MSVELPTPIAIYIAAANQGDADALATFPAVRSTFSSSSGYGKKIASLEIRS